MSDSKVGRKLGCQLLRIFKLFFPAQPYAKPLDKIFGGIAALLAVFGLLASTHYFVPDAKILVVASMGASAVLLFAAPHSPLAQPWAFAGGHMVSALVGVASYKFVPDFYLAAAVAVSVAIVLMHFLHCLHPPGGATALMAVLGGDAVHSLGFGYLLVPVGINVALFLALALLVNNLLVPKRRYPLPPVAPAQQKTLSKGAFSKLGLERTDLEDALKEIGAYIDVSGNDLEEIYSLASLHAGRRVLATVKVSDIIQREVPTCEYGDELFKVWEQMRIDRNLGLPVIDRSKRVIGIVTLVDLLKHVDVRPSGTLIDQFTQLIKRTPKVTSNKPEVAGQIMTTPAITVRDDDQIMSLIPLFAEDKIHHLPVVNADRRLVGMVTQADLMAYWLNSASLKARAALAN